ncbi:MAG: hypothetical protein ABI702_05485 [Burkholderiales bacterium]
MKPQDFLVALKLVALGDQHWTYARLAHELGMSASECHAAVQRGLASGLLMDAAIARAYAAPKRATAPAAREPGLGDKLAPAPAPEPRTNLDSAAVVNRHNLAEFALHGAKYAFPPERLPVGPGVPTSHSAPAFAKVFAPGHEAIVWPDPHGTVRGEGLAPLHPCVPGAALRDPVLYELLALFDALRAGRARERAMAAQRLPLLIAPGASLPTKSPRRG